MVGLGWLGMDVVRGVAGALGPPADSAQHVVVPVITPGVGVGPTTVVRVVGDVERVFVPLRESRAPIGFNAVGWGHAEVSCSRVR